MKFECKYENAFIVMSNHLHGIVEFVGVPLVGTQNTGHPQTTGQPQEGQPQGIAPTDIAPNNGGLTRNKI